MHFAKHSILAYMCHTLQLYIVVLQGDGNQTLIMRLDLLAGVKQAGPRPVGEESHLFEVTFTNHQACSGSSVVLNDKSDAPACT